MLRRRRFYVIYPEYFDSRLSRSAGRKVSKKLSDPEPHLKKLVKACEILEIDCQPQPEKSYPTRWWEHNGRILIPIDKNNKVPKTELLIHIAEISRKLVSRKKIQGTDGTDHQKQGKSVKAPPNRTKSAKTSGKKDGNQGFEKPKTVITKKNPTTKSKSGGKHGKK